MRYLSDRKSPREPQNQPMSVGSAFDAYAKAHLHKVLVNDGDPKFKFETLFEAQVEPDMRDWARKAGKFVFHFYQQHGGLANLMSELQDSIGPVRFEMDVLGAIEGSRESRSGEINKVPLLGKPDIFFINKEGCPIVLDWKVNGYCAKRNISPMPGYLHCLPGFNQHQDCEVGIHRGFKINTNPKHQLQQLNEDYARQLSIYGWLCGVEVGETFVAGIDQICCNATKEVYCEVTGHYGPAMRIAQHRTTISPEYQYRLRDRIHHIWECCTSGHFYPELTLEESQSRCQLIEQAYFSESLGFEERPQ